MADASIKIAKTVNFGKGLAGRSSHLFYSIYDTLGVNATARSASGVYELGTGTGIYGAQLTLAQAFSGSIVWELTASNGNVVFASDELEMDSRIVRHFTVGQWEVLTGSNEMVFYQEDNTTEIARFNLTDSDGSASVDRVFKRARK